MSIKNLAYEKNKLFSLFNQKKYKKIVNICKKLKADLFEDIEISKLLITSEIYLKNYSIAERYLQIILKKNNTAELNYLLGNILKLQQKNVEAIEAFKKAIELDKDFSEAYNNLANVQKKIKNYKEAKKNYEKSIEINKNNIVIFFILNIF